MSRSAISNKAIFYIVLIAVFFAYIYLIVEHGAALEEGKSIIATQSESNYWSDFLTSLKHSFTHPLAILLGQIASTIIVARFFGHLARKVRQPAVVGEVIAGIVLGPSLLGLYFPEFAATLFPKESLGICNFSVK